MHDVGPMRAMLERRRITIARKTLGVSLRDMAEMMGVALCTAHSREHGNTPVRREVLEEYAHHLGIPVEFLTGETDEMTVSFEDWRGDVTVTVSADPFDELIGGR